MGAWRRSGAAVVVLLMGVLGLWSFRGETRDLALSPVLRLPTLDQRQAGRAGGPRFLCLGRESFDLEAPLESFTVGRELRTSPRKCLSPQLPVLSQAELLAAAQTAANRESIALVRLASGHTELDALVRAASWTRVATKQIGSSFVGSYTRSTTRLDVFAWRSRTPSSVALLVLQTLDPREP